MVMRVDLKRRWSGERANSEGKMKSKKMIVLGIVGTLVLGHSAMAVENTATVGSSAHKPLDSTEKVSATELANFKANPKSLLTSNPIGGLQLTSLVKAIAMGDPSTVESLIALVASANPLQLAAIGSGLGQAAKLLKNSSDESDRQAADTIQSKIDGAKSEALVTAFKSGLTGVAAPFGKANIQSNQSGSTVGAVGGGVGGAVNQNTANAGSQGSTTTKTPPGSSTSSSNTTATTETIPFSGGAVTCTSSVSPTRVC
jgi:hypothetical protein